MTRKKPNYTQFMKRPAPLELSPPSDRDDSRPRSAVPPRKDVVAEDQLPWGEIVVEFGPDDSVMLDLTSQSASTPIFRSRPAPAQPEGGPPLGSVTIDDPWEHQDYADIEGIAVHPEPDLHESPAAETDGGEWSLPGPGAPPLVLMALAVVLLLCLL